MRMVGWDSKNEKVGGAPPKTGFKCTLSLGLPASNTRPPDRKESIESVTKARIALKCPQINAWGIP